MTEETLVKIKDDNGSGDHSTFAILDKLADIENLLESKSVSTDDQDYSKFESTYNTLKEQIFESFYTSPDIEDIIIDSDHRHHELVLRLYTEFMEEVSFLPFDNIEQDQEQTETYYHFEDAKNIENIEQTTLFAKGHTFDSDLKDHDHEPVTKLHSALNESEMFRLQNKIESLIALLGDAYEAHELSTDMLGYFLQARSIEVFQSKLNYIMDGYRLEKERLMRKLDKIEASIQESMRTLRAAGVEEEAVYTSRKVLKLNKKAVKLKKVWLGALHEAYRELDEIHEKLYSFYHHLIEHAKLN